MESMKIQIGNMQPVEAFTDGPGYLLIRQDDQEVSLHIVAALALAEFIVANRAEMTAAYKRHCQGKSNGNGG